MTSAQWLKWLFSWFYIWRSKNTVQENVKEKLKTFFGGSLRWKLKYNFYLNIISSQPSKIVSIILIVLASFIARTHDFCSFWLNTHNHKKKFRDMKHWNIRRVIFILLATRSVTQQKPKEKGSLRFWTFFLAWSKHFFISIYMQRTRIHFNNFTFQMVYRAATHHFANDTSTISRKPLMKIY